MDAVRLLVAPHEEMHEARRVRCFLPDFVAQGAGLIVTDVRNEFMNRVEHFVECVRADFIPRQFVNLAGIPLDVGHVASSRAQKMGCVHSPAATGVSYGAPLPKGVCCIVTACQRMFAARLRTMPNRLSSLNSAAVMRESATVSSRTSACPRASSSALAV
jgi:hypothetical protein